MNDISHNSLPDAFEKLSRRDRYITLMSRDNEPVVFSFEQLMDRALGLLHYFQSRGINQGDELIIAVNGNAAFLDAYWACLFGGIIPVPIAPGISDEQKRKLLRVFDTLKHPTLFTEHGLAGRLLDHAKKTGFQEISEVIRRQTILVEDITDLQ